MNYNLLKQFGLKNSDIRVYKSLVSLGRSKTGEIIKKSGLVSSVVYTSLKRLIQKGLVSYVVRNNIKYYKAELPDRLLDETLKLADGITTLSKEISETMPSKRIRNSVNTFEEEYGFKKALMKHVEELEEGEEICIVAFSNSVNFKKEPRKFFKELDTVMKPKKCSVRMIMDEKMRNSRAHKDRKETLGYSFRFLASDFFGFNAVNISKREALLSVYGETPMAISIQKPELVKGFQRHFDFLWDKASE